MILAFTANRLLNNNIFLHYGIRASVCIEKQQALCKISINKKSIFVPLLVQWNQSAYEIVCSIFVDIRLTSGEIKSTSITSSQKTTFHFILLWLYLYQIVIKCRLMVGNKTSPVKGDDFPHTFSPLITKPTILLSVFKYIVMSRVTLSSHSNWEDTN